MEQGRAGHWAQLAGERWGDRSDQRAPLVLLHGLSFNRAMWAPALAELSKRDPARRVLALDLPGHGASPAGRFVGLEATVAAVTAAELEAPVLVGHSIAGLVVTVYAARHPNSGVVNVDQPLQVRPFAQLVQSLKEQLHSADGFTQVWKGFASSMHPELLSSSAQQILGSTVPPQDLVLGYWNDVLTRDIDDLAAWTDHEVAAFARQGRPYLVVSGEKPTPEYRTWLSARLPTVELQTWAGSGHFPHLAQPQRFGHLLSTR